MLIAPGSSLGGGRPKASVTDTQKHLWIAKFPSRNDEKDIAAWEMVANDLALKAGIHVAGGKLARFNNQYHTFLSKRFDRTDAGGRIHFASAMTMLGKTDGEGSEGTSYPGLMEFISRNGAKVTEDLQELWKRIVFSICIKNTDDHLRNHGFLLTNKGWILSPAYDLNPNEYGTGLHLNITDTDNALDTGLAMEVAAYFRLTKKRAAELIDHISGVVRDWRKIASAHRLTKAEQERMASAFE